MSTHYRILEFYRIGSDGSVINFEKQMFIKMRCEQPVVSNTLSDLKRLGVVKFDREGKNMFYSIDKEGVQKINNATRNITWKVKA